MNSDMRLKKLRVRSWRRGTREMDLLLGQFADRYLATMTEDEVMTFGELLTEGDPTISDLVFARRRCQRYDSLVQKIREYHGMGRGRE